MQVFLGAVVAALVFGVIGPQVEVCSSTIYACRNTGSLRGFTRWPFGLQSSHWTKISPVETYLREHSPASIRRDWRQVADTGVNYFGDSISFSCGGFNAGSRGDHELLEKWIGLHSDAEVMDLYRVFLSHDQARIDRRLEEIEQEIEPS
jgi:hypothetical protein